MKIVLRITLLLIASMSCLMLNASKTRASDSDEISIISELKRMRSADHLYRPNNYRTVQYSGFNRVGGNPDNPHCLYEEGKWRVVADHKGPGVVTRIWTAARQKWSTIRIELDGKVVYEGSSEVFLGSNKFPRAVPMSEVRFGARGSGNAWMYRKGEKPPEGVEIGTDNEDVPEKGTVPRNKMPARWGETYFPMPFKKRFRYMQVKDDVYYANIEIKSLDPGTKVQSYNDADWKKVRAEWEKTISCWKKMSLYHAELKTFQKVTQTLKFAKAIHGKKITQPTIQIKGPGIIRSIRINVPPQFRRSTFLKAWWDGDQKTGLDTSLDLGFGSRKYRTLAIGQRKDGTRVLEFPMPFKKSANLQFSSFSKEEVTITVDIYYEKKTELPKDVMYLNCYHNADMFDKKNHKFLFPNVPKPEFLYHNGYTVVDLVGSGHLVAYMDLYHCQPELDEHIFIDGEREFPKNKWNGTGHEDLFGMAHAHKNHTAPMTSGGSESQKEANVRLFWTGTMPFKKEFRWNWEWSFQLKRKKPPRDAAFETVVYWYSAPKGITIKKPTFYSTEKKRNELSGRTVTSSEATSSEKKQK